MDRSSKNSAQRWDALLPVMNDHVLWFHDVLFCLFYPEDKKTEKKIQKPTSFATWFLDASRDPLFESEIIEKLNALHKDLMDHAEILIVQERKPSFNQFNIFMTHYEEFISHIRRLEHDFMVENSGYDPLLGLRNIKLLYTDIVREMDRLGRQGKNFTIAMARLDHFADIQKFYSKSECEAFIRLVADLIKLSIRSFDDAYYMGSDKFILVLKQSEVKGGIAALERLRRELERRDVVYTFGNIEKAMSMSCCITEPSDVESIEDLIRNLEKDLDSNKEIKGDAVLEYYEMSPLQRFIKENAQR